MSSSTMHGSCILKYVRPLKVYVYMSSNAYVCVLLQDNGGGEKADKCLLIQLNHWVLEVWVRCSNKSVFYICTIYDNVCVPVCAVNRIHRPFFPKCFIFPPSFFFFFHCVRLFVSVYVCMSLLATHSSQTVPPLMQHCTQ